MSVTVERTMPVVAQPDPLAPRELRRVFAHLPSAVVAVCGQDGGRPVGMAASSFTTVSLTPPLVSFCASNTSATWARLRRLPRLGISVLAENQDCLCRALAADVEDRF